MQTALEALLSGSSADPVRRALGLDALDRQLRPLLPQALAPHVRLANVAGGRLVMLVDSPVWHARLRLAAPELIDAARSVGLDVREVVIRPTREPLHLPAAAGQRASVTPGHGGRSAATQEAFHAALAALAEPAAGGESGR